MFKNKNLIDTIMSEKYSEAKDEIFLEISKKIASRITKKKAQFLKTLKEKRKTGV
jgi:hypothetical protein